MSSGKAVLGSLLKWTLVLALGAAIGGYVVFIYHDSPPAPKILAGEDPAAIKPGSDSTSPVATNTPPEEGTTSTPSRSENPPSSTGSDSGAAALPEGITGPDVDISVKPVAAGPSPEEVAARRHRHRRKVDSKTKPTKPDTKPPAETFLPDQSGGDKTGGAGDKGGTGGTDGGGTGGGTDGGDTAGGIGRG